jgi:hypothetical protein
MFNLPLPGYMVLTAKEIGLPEEWSKKPKSDRKS